MKTETIILSIHPSHIEKILSGEKQYEYRKRIPTHIQHIVVYATAPIKMIVALIEVDTVIRGTPESIWGKTKKHAGVSKDFFMQYFADHEDSYAIKFKTVLKLKKPKNLMCLKSNINPQQSYTYLEYTTNELCKKLDINNYNVD